MPADLIIDEIERLGLGCNVDLRRLQGNLAQTTAEADMTSGLPRHMPGGVRRNGQRRGRMDVSHSRATRR